MALTGGGEGDGRERDGGEVREALCLCTLKGECPARVAPAKQREDEMEKGSEREKICTQTPYNLYDVSVTEDSMSFAVVACVRVVSSTVYFWPAELMDYYNERLEV